ncbi:MAG: DUF6580 family putative transport protein [Candidatus Omnitrophota bacterium]
MLALSLILIGIILRVMPHAANFTPVAAIALFSGVYLKKKYALFVPLILIIVTDLIIGMHNVVFFTWGTFVLMTLMGFWVKQKKTVTRTVSASLLSSILFYLTTNFGVWLAGWYTRDLKGLIHCYVMGLPFLRNFAVSTLIYTTVFFLTYELIAKTVKDTKFSKVLLSS